MKILSLGLSVLICIITSACATTMSLSATPVQANADPAADTAAAPDPGSEPGHVVLKGDLVAIGESEQLSPVTFPQNIAKSVATAEGCESGPGGVEVANTTEFYLQMMVDGEDIMVLGPKTTAQFVAPKSKVYLCLDPSKEHVITGTAVKPVLATLYRVPITFHRTIKVDGKQQVKFPVNYRLLAASAESAER